MLDKTPLFDSVINELEKVYQIACLAADRAHESATNKANKAENQYDTLGLEAAYLAHGQSLRVAECAQELTTFKDLANIIENNHTRITFGSLVQLLDEDDNSRWLLLSPCAGGVNVLFQHNEVTLITPSSPLGSVLMGLNTDDNIDIEIAGKTVNYEIVAVY